MNEGPELSKLTQDILKSARQKPGSRIRSEFREVYFISDGTGMEFWEVLKKQGYNPEELEECKNELKEKELLHVRKVDDAQPYYARYSGKLGSSMSMMFIQERDHTGHAQMDVTEKREKLEINEKALEKHVNTQNQYKESVSELLQTALNIIKDEETDKKEAIQQLDEKGVLPDLVKHSMDEEKYLEDLEQLKNNGVAEKKVERLERRKCVRFKSEWVEETPRTRFYFAPEIFEEYFKIE